MKTLNKNLILKAIDVAIEELRKQKQDKEDIGSILWDIGRYEQLKEEIESFSKINEIDLLQKHGGTWLGVVRNYIQCKFINGETVSWGSHEELKKRSPLTVLELEQFSARIAASAINEIFN